MAKPRLTKQLATRIDCCFPVFPTTKDAPFDRAPKSGIHIYAGLVVLVIVSFRTRFQIRHIFFTVLPTDHERIANSVHARVGHGGRCSHLQGYCPIHPRSQTTVVSNARP